MKDIVKSIAHAFIEVSRVIPPTQYPELSDGVLFLLMKYRCRRSDLRRFQKLVERIVQEQEGTFPVTVATPSGRSREEAEGIVAVLERIVGKRMQLLEQKDPSLLGGMRVAFGDERIDATLRGRLLQLQTHLCSTQSLPS